MDEQLVSYGSAVKDLGNGRVGGYLVLFGSPTEADLDRQYFTKSTDFEIADGTTTPIRYHHGRDKVIGRRVLGRGVLKAADDLGVWIEGQLDLRDKYEQAVYALVKAGKLGWSSGSAPHLVETKKTGSTEEILSWPLGLDATLTPIPADPRNSATALKSLPEPPSLEQLLAMLTTAEKSSNEPTDPHGGLTLSAHVEATLAAADTFTGLATNAVARLGTIIEDRTVKAGRAISATNMGRVADIRAAAESIVASCDALAAAAEPKPAGPVWADAKAVADVYAVYQQSLARSNGVET